jgi:chromosomal replication initiation ATPase DnaA
MEIPQLRQLKPRKTPVAIVEAVCQEFNCQGEQVLRKGAKKNTARDVAIYIVKKSVHIACEASEATFYEIINPCA